MGKKYSKNSKQTGRSGSNETVLEKKREYKENIENEVARKNIIKVKIKAAIVIQRAWRR